jgi:hypothetical protein
VPREHQRHELVAKLVVGEGPAVLVGGGEQQRSARRLPSPAARRSRITAYIWRSTIAVTAASMPLGSAWRALRISTSRYSGDMDAASMPRSAWRIRRSASVVTDPAPTPKTPRMITSRVTACIRGASANGSPTGQRSISCSATSAIIAT